ncbi:hypothetical protein R3P38DRAFT_3195099 [Favolaschia claudopus]|uniref:F-box domain-containing protein n=1 Tax=Favolaschia claudopus TaxID=2862362 RepID=A0AAW0BAX7_9AGAR
MAVLLDLSPELVIAVLDHLAPFSQTLDNLCLAGNRNLLALVRPYTWREVDITLSDNRKTSAALAERLSAFCSDSAKITAVRSLNITVMGSFDYYEPASSTLWENLPHLVNVTHTTVNCVNSYNRFASRDLPRYIQAIVEELPSLMSLVVDGCLDQCHDGGHNMRKTPIPSLRHLRARFCQLHPMGEGVSVVWSYCSNLEVVELAGGLVEKFFKQHSLLTDAQIKAQLQGTSESLCGMYDILNPPHNARERPAVFHTAKTLKLISDANSSGNDLVRLFAEDLEEPSESLTEVFLDLAICAESFGVILWGFRSPIIERMGVIAADDGCWISGEFDQLLARIKNGALFFAGFESLEELVLPCDGISPETPATSASPGPRPCTSASSFAATDCGDLAAAAKTYAEAISTLASVSWRNRCCFCVSRAVSASSVQLGEGLYEAPSWQGWNGIGKWWEI